MAKDLNRSIKIYIDNSDSMKKADALKTKISALDDELTKLNAAGKRETAEYQQKEKALIQLQASYDRYQQKISATEQVLKNLSGATREELEKARKDIQGSLRKMSSDADGYKESIKQLTAVEKQLAVVKAEQNGVLGKNATFWSRAADGFNKYFGMVTAAIAAITGITLVLNKFRDLQLEKEDSKANLKALTGLDDNSIGWLTEQAEKLSTSMTDSRVRITQSSKEILDAYTIVGSAKPELLKNKEALDQVTQQSMILAKASKMDLGEAVNGLTISMNMYNASADDAARYTNVLAAGSKEGAAEVSSITQSLLKSGVAASQAEIPIEQLVGSIETLAEKGIKDEIAGTGLKSFFIKLQGGADDTNPKIVGLQTALENLQKKQLSATELQNQFGLETFTVASAMIENAQKVKYYTNAVTGTNIAMEQAQINSDTTSSKITQQKNKVNELGIALVEKLNPAILSGTKFTAYFLEGISNLPKWLAENKGLIIALTSATIAYAIAVAASVKVDEAKAFINNTLIGSFKKLWATIRENPYALIGMAIAAVITVLYKFITYQTNAEKALKEFNEEAAKETSELNNIFEAYKRANSGTAEKKRLLDLIKEKYGDYIRNLIDEKGNITDIEAAQRMANKALREGLALKIKNKQIEAVSSEEIKKQSDYYSELRDKLPSGFGDAYSNEVVNHIGELFRNENKSTEAALKEATKYLADAGVGTAKRSGSGSSGLSVAHYLDEIKRSEDRMREEKKQIESKFEGLLPSEPIDYTMPSDWSSKKASKTDSGKQPKGDTGGKKTPENDKKGKTEAELQKEELDKKLKQLDEYILAEQNKYAQLRLNGKISEDTYNAELLRITQEAMQKKMAILGVSPNQQKALLDLTLEYQKKYFLELKGLEEEYLDSVAKYSKEAAEERLKNANSGMKELSQKITQDTQKQFEKETARRKRMLDLTQSLSDDMGGIIGGAISGNSDLVKSSMQNIVNLGLDLLKTQMEMAIAGATMQSLAQPDSVATFGASGFARAAVMVGLIEAAFAAVKAVVGSAFGGSSSKSSSSSGGSGTYVVNQAAAGKYDVIGADDGKTYRNVPYAGVATSGIVTVPTLVGEQGTELIVSAPDFSKLQRHINYPLVVQAIKDAQAGTVPQRAQGKYHLPPAPSNRGGDGQATQGFDYDRLDRLMDALDKFTNKDLSVNYYSIEKAKTKVDTSRSLGKKR